MNRKGIHFSGSGGYVHRNMEEENYYFTKPVDFNVYKFRGDTLIVDARIDFAGTELPETFFDKQYKNSVDLSNNAKEMTILVGFCFKFDDSRFVEYRIGIETRYVLLRNNNGKKQALHTSKSRFIRDVDLQVYFISAAHNDNLI